MSNSLLSKDNINRPIQKKEASEDLFLYFDLIDQQHGNPYQYVSRRDFLEAINHTIDQLPEVLDYKSFELELAKLNNLIRCGHTTVKINTSTYKKIIDDQVFFPLPVSIIDDRVYVDFDQSIVPHGSELLTINNRVIDDLLPAMKELVATDGYSDTKRERELESRFGYYVFLTSGTHQSFEVSYLDPNNQLKTARLDGVAGNEMIANNYYRPLYQSHERYYHFTHVDAIDSLQTIVLTLNTFQANPSWFYENLSSLYQNETKTFTFNHLVLDLRNNHGGDRRILNFLYEFLTGNELVDPSHTSTRTIDIANEEYLEGINGRLSSDKTISEAKNYLNKHFTSSEGGLYRGTEQNWHQTFDAGIQWEGMPFEGQIYVLTSGKTFSAAADFARILGQLDHVTLIGEETGGAHVGRTANMLLNYSLPHSQSKVQIPVIYEEFVHVNESNNKGRGTFPDYYVKETLTDLIAQRDTPFDFTLNLIQSKQQQGSN